MFQLFNKRFTISGSINKAPGDQTFYRASESMLDGLIAYYQDRIFGLQNQHILVRILNSATLPYSYPWDRFSEVVETRSPYIGKSFRLTSSINGGTWFDGTFYGENIREYILVDEDSVYYFDIQKNWKNASPVNVLWHPISDFGLQIPVGAKKSTAEGMAVISINLPMLFYQYRAFMEDQMSLQKSGSSQILGSAHFVRRYVLPKMLKTHFEIVMLNRLMNSFYELPMSEQLGKHPMAVKDVGPMFDKTFTPMLKKLKDSKKMYAHTLMSLPSLFYEDMQESLVWPEIVPTNYVTWLLLLSRLKVVDFLLDLQGENGKQANTGFLNKTRVELSRQLSGSIPISSIHPEDLLAFQTLFEKLKK